MKTTSAGRTLLKTIAGFTTVGGFVMDWNKTHLFNPNWAPHAKFHDGMTILLGSFLGAKSLYLLQKKHERKNEYLAAGALLPALFYAAQAGAFAFPGAKEIDVEFPEKVPTVGKLTLNEMPFSLVMLAGLGIGYYLARKEEQKQRAF